MSIKKYIANASEEFDKVTLHKIEASFEQAKTLVKNELDANKIDIVFVNAPRSVIPEYGIGGYAPGPYNIYISLDPKNNKFSEKDLIASILHEAHHCMRWRGPGYGVTLGETMISEGLATLAEDEFYGYPPLYGQVEITEEEIDKAKGHLDDKEYKHSKWFFGDKEIQRWFAYTYGYMLCKEYSTKTNKTACQLVNIDARLILGQKNK
jgi:uncharacterized protein YjaZ